ncbi:serine/threonine-protein kinase [Ancylothrix sp. C2]|uniref:serine/threonine-protein kinase n=1 Tax=Ancylothrix sp. D3o TaxID=2953691 RepID=UPI0021BB3AB1|nr:serine/threonine-protein kinase [Ancylothrix sp. D3o]MCT7952641.1 serine/threonine-protein kinase [Ancylothrix sp. D3o]
MYWKPNQKLENGKYIIENVIGSGGFGITYKARETASGKLIAIKTLNAKQHQEPDFEKRQVDFMNEAMRLAKFSHPHIPKVDQVFKEGDILGVVMEYINGENLHDYIENKGILSPEEALKIIRQVGEALTFVHERGFLHRDVKPQNILLRPTSLDAVLIDFGLAREFVQGMEMSHTASLTHGFAPIEQYERRAERGTFTDVYALAATYYVMRTGKVPFPANFRKDANIPLTAPKQYNPEISERENQAILKGMELLPKARPQTVGEWLELLKEEADDLSSDRGVDYSQLRDYLKAGMWKEADQETACVMLKAAGREKEGRLRVKEIGNFPCVDLRTINKLWVKYSNGRFGFSVQKRIYESLGGMREFDEKIWDAFGDRVGWRVNGEWLSYSNLQFNKQAKTGHLPKVCVGVRGGFGGWFFGVSGWAGWGGFSSLASRLAECNI